MSTSNSPTNQNLPFRPQVLSLQHVIESDPNYWNDQLNYGFPSEFLADPQAEPLQLPDSSVHQQFESIRQFFREPESTISLDPAINSTSGNSYNPSLGINPATLDLGPLVKPVPQFIQAGYHIDCDGTVLPVFVSLIFYSREF
jgi:hypothetical protein